jgi:hypothetical protein
MNDIISGLLEKAEDIRNEISSLYNDMIEESAEFDTDSDEYAAIMDAKDGLSCIYDDLDLEVISTLKEAS